MALPEIGFVRLPHIIGDPNAVPPIPAVIPVKKSTWWSGVKTGRFPKPVKLGPNITAWRVEEIRDLIAELAAEEGDFTETNAKAATEQETDEAEEQSA